MIDGYAYNQSGNPWEANHLAPLNLPNMRLARAYIPFQVFTKSFPPREALDKGTMFPELYSPYYDYQKKGM